MKLDMTFSILAACAIAVSGQNLLYAQQPDNDFTFSNLTAGARQISSNYEIDDFIFSFVNPNAGDITVKTTLTADNSNFQFAYQTPNANPPTLTCSTQGSYTYDDRPLAQAGTDALNVLNVSMPVTTTEFTGSVHIESLGYENFYVSSANDLSVSSVNSHATMCDAYYDAWQNGAWSVPWYWDGNASVLVSPYANNWKNHAFWDKGWNSSLSVTNNGSQSVEYGIYYRTAKNLGQGNPLSFDPNSYPTCESHNLSHSTSHTVGVSQTWSGDLNSILNPNSSHAVEEDGFFYITLNPVISGSSPTQNINPNSSGTATICGQLGGGVTCPVITSCQ